MTKSGYLSASGKLLMISSVLLLFANAAVFIGAHNTNIASWAGRISDFVFYIVLLLGFLAFNGEGIAYKRSRELKRKKRTNILKLLLFFAFILRFIKKPIEGLFLAFAGENIAGALIKLFLGLFNTLASYGFLFTIVALWYCTRDENHKKLYYIELFAFVIGVINSFYKALNFSVTKYSLTYFGEFFEKVFTVDAVSHSLILIQFFIDAVMFFLVMKTYGKFLADEQYEKEKINKTANYARNIYNSECVGIDFLDDDYLLN